MGKAVKAARAGSLVFTLFGDMVHRLNPDGELGLGSLVALMAPFGISEAAVRQAVSRMARQGWLQSRRTAKRALYGVTERGRRRIQELAPRVYGPVVEWDGIWRLLTYSIGESRREQRDRLRKEMAVLGWAPLSAATWISPADSLSAVRDAAKNSRTSDSIHLFSGEYRGPLTDRELLERCWDVTAIASAYREFVDRYRPALEREREHADLTDESAFARRLEIVHEYRKFAYRDPGLPSELLPAHWPGTTAAAAFREYYGTLERKSQRYFHRVVSQNGGKGEGVEPTRPCPKPYR